MTRLAKRFWRDRSGATAIEYGLIASLIFVVIVGSVAVFGEQLQALFQTVEEAFSGLISGED